jgi:plasmid rolling circle replication initiator protein Rep
MENKRIFYAPDGDVRLTINIRKELKQKLHIAKVMTDKNMGDLIEQLISEKLDEILKKGIK